MGLYLCVFGSDETDDDLDGVEIGRYEYFGEFREAVHRRAEPGAGWGGFFPTLLEHSDCEGEWTVGECAALLDELAAIRVALAAFDAPPYQGWMAEAAAFAGHRAANLAEYFIDVDGEILLDRIARLARFAIETGRPITFM